MHDEIEEELDSPCWNCGEPGDKKSTYGTIYQCKTCGVEWRVPGETEYWAGGRAWNTKYDYELYVGNHPTMGVPFTEGVDITRI